MCALSVAHMPVVRSTGATQNAGAAWGPLPAQQLIDEEAEGVAGRVEVDANVCLRLVVG